MHACMHACTYTHPLDAREFDLIEYLCGIFVCKVTTTDEWGDVMYTTMEYKSYAALFFVVQMLIGLCKFLYFHIFFQSLKNLLRSHTYTL